MALESDLKIAAKRFSTDDGFQQSKKRCNRRELVPINDVNSANSTTAATSEQPLNLLPMETAEAVKGTSGPPQSRFEPFFVKVVSNWMELVKDLNSRLTEPVHAKLVGEMVKITPKNVTEYRTIQRFLLEKNLEFAGFSKKDERPKKVSIRGLPSFTDGADIVAGLTKLGFSVQSAHGICQKKTKAPLNIFIAYILPTENWEAIYKVNLLCCMQVNIRAFNSKGVRQCYRCQRFNHSSYVCHFSSRCVKCAGNHFARDCPNPADQIPRCCNCDGQHTANYSLCPKYPSKSKNAGQAPARRQGPPAAPQIPPAKPPASTPAFTAANPPGTSAWANGPPSAPVGAVQVCDPVLPEQNSATATPSKLALLKKVQARKKPRTAVPPTGAPPPAVEKTTAPPRSAEDTTVSPIPAPAKRQRVSDAAAAHETSSARDEIQELRNLGQEFKSQLDFQSIRHYIKVLREIMYEISRYDDEGDKFMAFFEVYERNFCVGSFFDGE